jgi:Terminase large subunit, T4likevirus-type, N-terminal
MICGRRSGKSFVMALIAVFLACFRNYQPFLGPGEKATIMIIAADKKQARVVLRFVRGLLSAPVLAARVISDTVESIELEGSVTLEVITASNAVRGYTVAACLCDELAFWPADEASTSGAEVIAAIRPTMLTIPGSLLICASSPYARRGPLWDAYRRYHGKDHASVLVVASSDVDDEPVGSAAGDRRGL